VHGWTQVIAQVLHIDLDKELLERLKAVAESVRVISNSTVVF
jgi:hypothetical protein